jgi:hypothetical protein
VKAQFDAMTIDTLLHPIERKTGKRFTANSVPVNAARSERIVT